MPKLYMLVGVPGSGKSTWRAGAGLNDAVVISTDDYIDFVADQLGVTYSEAFKDHIKAATQLMDKRAREAFAAGKDVVWDQTNTTRKSRVSKLSIVPKGYEKTAVFFPTPADLKQRLAGRPGKNIPDDVIANMIASLQPPTKDEGFDEVITV